MLINSMKQGLYISRASVEDFGRECLARSFCCTCGKEVPLTNLVIVTSKTIVRVQSYCDACGEELFLFSGHERDSENERKLLARIAELEKQVQTLTDTAMAELHLSTEDKAGF